MNTVKKELTLSLPTWVYEEFEKEVRDSTVEEFIESVLTQKAYEIKEGGVTQIETFYWTPVTPDSPTFEGREIAVFRDARTKRIIRQEYVNSYTNNSIFIFEDTEVPIEQLEWLAPTV